MVLVPPRLNSIPVCPPQLYPATGSLSGGQGSAKRVEKIFRERETVKGLTRAFGISSRGRKDFLRMRNRRGNAVRLAGELVGKSSGISNRQDFNARQEQMAAYGPERDAHKSGN
jgi:hypothetical protein